MLRRDVAGNVAQRLGQLCVATEKRPKAVGVYLAFRDPLKKLMGTGCNLKWREEKNEREILWVTRPGHPIVAHIDDHFILPAEEMYGEFFDIPEPESTFLISSFGGGEVFRSGCTWTRGAVANPMPPA